jgi:hypothetical protein
LKSIHFKFNLDEKVTVIQTGFSGIISLCAIQGDPASPEIVYFVNGVGNCNWYAERLLKGAE